MYQSYQFNNHIVKDHIAGLQAEADRDRLARQSRQAAPEVSGLNSLRLEILRAIKQDKLSVEEALYRLNSLEEAQAGPRSAI